MKDFWAKNTEGHAILSYFFKMKLLSTYVATNYTCWPIRDELLHSNGKIQKVREECIFEDSKAKSCRMALSEKNIRFTMQQIGRAGRVGS